MTKGRDQMTALRHGIECMRTNRLRWRHWKWCMDCFATGCEFANHLLALVDNRQWQGLGFVALAALEAALLPPRPPLLFCHLWVLLRKLCSRQPSVAAYGSRITADIAQVKQKTMASRHVQYFLLPNDKQYQSAHTLGFGGSAQKKSAPSILAAGPSSFSTCSRSEFCHSRSGPLRPSGVSTDSIAETQDMRDTLSSSRCLDLYRKRNSQPGLAILTSSERSSMTRY